MCGIVNEWFLMPTAGWEIMFTAKESYAQDKYHVE